MDIVIVIIEKILPTIVALVVVYLGYSIWVKQKIFEEKNEKLRKIRQSISNLLLIWKELSMFEKSINPNDQYNEILFKNSKLLRKFLNVDRLKIERLNKSYIESIDNLRSYDITLFYNLESSFEGFNNSFNDFLNPIITDKSINITNKYRIIFPVLQNTIRELEDIITDTSGYLNKAERDTVYNILHNHIEEINKPQENKEIPAFVVELINTFLPLKEDISKNDFIILYNNETVKWLMLRVLNTNLISCFLDYKPIDVFRMLQMFNQDNTELISELNKGFDKNNLINFISITNEESNKFIDNRDFYKLIIGAISKFEGVTPFEIKRTFVKLNNGEIFLKDKLEELKKQLM